METYQPRPEEIVRFEVLRLHDEEAKSRGKYRLHHSSRQRPVTYEKPVEFEFAMDLIASSLSPELQILYVQPKDTLARQELHKELPLKTLNLAGRIVRLAE